MTLPLDPPMAAPSSKRRSLADRRESATSLWAALRPGGRRQAFRRDGESRDRYVDVLSRRTVILSVLIVVLSSMDAFLTLLHLEGGGWEVNPIMRLALECGLPVFIGVKTFGTGLAVVFLAIHQNFRLSWISLHAAAVGYVMLLAYHLFLLL